MPVLKKVASRYISGFYIFVAALLGLGILVTDAPSQILLVMFIPSLMAAVVYKRKVYLLMLLGLAIVFFTVLIVQHQSLYMLMGVVAGFIFILVAAEALQRFMADREKMNIALREREAISRAIIEKSPLGISVRSSTGKLLSYNQAWRTIWALSEEVVNEDMTRERQELVFDLRDNYLGDAIAEVRKVYHRGGQIYLPEMKVGGKRPGSAEWVSQYFYAIQNPDGEVNQVVILTEDISERKRMEKAEAEQRIFAEALVDTAAVLNSTLKLEELLDCILINVGRVVPHDAVNLMLLQDGVASVIRSRGYTDFDPENSINQVHWNLADTPYLRKMVQTGLPLFVTDTQQDPDWRSFPATVWIRSYAGAPIRIKGNPVGFLNLDSAKAGFYTALHTERLRSFTDQVAIAIENARLYEEVQRLAIMDELTGVYNFRGLFELGQREFDRSRRYNHPLSALFFDIDHFRLFNKQYTHSVGNQVLKQVAACSKTHVRKVDLVARYGGEEFTILLAETNADAALQVAERLRQDIEIMQIPSEDGNLSVTISIGVAELAPDVKDLAMLLDRADQAEHIAKESGRNQVSLWTRP